MKNYLTNSIEVAGLKARYDSEVKKLLSDKKVLSWIMKHTAEEFTDCTIEEIMELIEGKPIVSEIPIYPGKTPEAITGMPTSDKVPNEGEITFDIRFHIRTPDGKHLKMLINVEAQKNYYPGYDIVTRAIFYCTRMLSAQLDTEFKADDYDNIKKVYSIWICLEPPQYARNTITEYHIEQKKLYGDFKGKARYDLMSAVILCLGKDETDVGGQPVHRMLNTLLSENLTPAQKQKILHEEFGFSMTCVVKEGMDNMCNLSDLIEERATKRGMEKGMEKGIKQGIETSISNTIEILRDMGEANEDIISRILSKFDISRELVEKYL